MKELYYIVPHKDFFKKNPAGRVAHVKGICNGLSKNQVKVTLICEDGVSNFTKEFEDKVEIIPVINKLSLLGKFGFYLALIENIKNNKIKYSIVRHDPFFILILFLLAPSFFKNISMVEVNGFAFDVKVGFLKYLTKASIVLYAISCIGFKWILCVNSSIKNDLGLTKLIKDKKLVLFQNGGPDESFLPFISSKNIEFIFYGGLNSYVGFNHLVEAFSMIEDKNTFLHIVGFGPDERKVKDLIRNKKNIRFHQGMRLQELRNFISSKQLRMVGLIPMAIDYKDSNLHPIKAYEYMSLSLPMIYADCTMNGVLFNKKNSISYKYGEKQSLAKAMQEYISKKQIYNEYKREIERIYSKFTWEKRMKEFLERVDVWN